MVHDGDHGTMMTTIKPNMEVHGDHYTPLYDGTKMLQLLL